MIPLAEQLRPKRLEDVIGQLHLLGEGKPLQSAYVKKLPHSFVLWGPPGVGKTTLAEIMAHAWEMHFIKLSAVFSGVKDIKQAIDEAIFHRDQHGRGTVLFVDEIHRFNKSQQDAFLQHLESGLLTLIGATTENPSFELNAALLSRLQVYVLNALTDEDLSALFQRAISASSEKIVWSKEAQDFLIAASDGDARRLLNLIEISHNSAAAKALKNIDASFVASILPKTLRRFDKGGEVFYDQISALHKSVRGSNPDAALYWLCRMLDGGVDPLYLARRIVRMAWEDIGLADPRAMEIVNSAATTFERLGSPEGELALGIAVVYLAVAAKSNAGYEAFKAASSFVKKDKTREVPIHLRNAPTKLMKNLGYGKEYRYAHNEPHHYAANENYFPEGLSAPSFYTPTDQGLEVKIREKMAFLRELDKKAREDNKN